MSESRSRAAALREMQRLVDQFNLKSSEVRLPGWATRRVNPTKHAGRHSRVNQAGLEYINAAGQRWVPGRGRPPLWVIAARAAGTLESFARTGPDPVTGKS